MEEKFDPSFKYPRHPKAHPKGGVHLTEKAGQVRDIGLSLLKQMGVKIKEGGVFDLLRISRPAIISYPKTYLECVGGDFLYTSLLNKAAATKDPLVRMQYVIAFFLAGIHKNSVEMQNNGPLNPVVGETYVAEKSDGTMLYCEQISHHPPVSAFLIVGPNRSYKLFGTGELDVQMTGFNHIIGRRIGKTTLEYPDGSKIVFTNPETRIDGLLMGDRRYGYHKTSVFLDKKNKISAEVNFMYEESGTITKLTSGLKSLWGGKKEKPPQDSVEIIFFRYEKAGEDVKKEVLCEGTGSWLSFVQVDNKMLWRIDQETDVYWTEDPAKRLPSDSTYREDSKYIKLKDFDNAQREKEALENKQRADAKLRKEAADKKGGSKSNL